KNYIYYYKVMSMNVKIHVWGVGNSTLGDDGVGIFVAKMLKKLSPPYIEVTICESVPENFILPLRRKKPQELVIVDAALMNLPPGSIRRIPLAQSEGFILTHGLPFLTLIESQIKNCNVTIIGIQPETRGFSTKLSTSVHEAARKLVKIITTSRLRDIPLLTS
ncbi:MAG: hydrogenase maturation protease, partial [Acetomicrobium sp.]